MSLFEVKKKLTISRIGSMVLKALKLLSIYLNPLFHFRFSKEAYLSSSHRPYGWWRHFPKLHYFVFSYGKGYLIPSAIKIRKKNKKNGLKTVLFISHELTRTGAPILLLNLMHSFSRKYNIALISMEGGGMLKEFCEIASWVDVPGAMCGNSKRFMTRQISRIATDLDVKFAIVNTIECAQVLLPLRRQNIPSIHLIHEFSMGDSNNSAIELSALYANATVFSSQLVKNSAACNVNWIDNPKTHVIPQGIFDPSRETQSQKSTLGHTLQNEPGEVIVLGAGTVDYRKGVDLFLDCAKKTIAKNPEKNIRFIWLGSKYHSRLKPYQYFLSDQIKKYELGDRFQELDEVTDFKEVCRQADIFFLPSRLDPLPIVAQTAIACGIPVVCFDKATGISEFLFTDEQAAYGVSPYLDTDVASDKIIELARNREFRNKVGAACRKLSDTFFDKTTYIDKLEELAAAAAIENDSHKKDIATIAESGLFNPHFASRKYKDGSNSALTNYVYLWRRGRGKLRKPMPGFHPGVYLEDAMAGRWGADPFADYIRKGMPTGRWSHKVLIPRGKVPSFSGTLRSALHLHFYYTQGAENIIKRASLSDHRPQLLISVPTAEAAQEIETMLSKYQGWKYLIKVVPNRGRDVAPFLTAFAGELQSYEIIGHVHAKETAYNPHREEIERWNNFLLENMIGGGYPMIDFIMSCFHRDKKLGLVFPDDPNILNWTANRLYAEELAQLMKFDAPLPENINFPVGTMFWARSEALAPLFKLNLDWDDYPQEPVASDGSMLHAFERLIPLVVQKSGYRADVTHIPGIYR
jgi:glycosyltransferase involved in cell wall biosynthesis